MIKFCKIGQLYDYDYYYDDTNDVVDYQCIVHPLVAKKSLATYLFRLFSSERFAFLRNRLSNYFCFKQYLKGLNIKRYKNEQIVFLINDVSNRFLDTKLLFFLKKNFKNAKIVYQFPDTISLAKSVFRHFDIPSFKKMFDFVFTYNLVDSVEYNIPLAPPKLLKFREPKCDIKRDVFFVGKNKNRLNSLVEIYDRLTLLGFDCLFIINDVNEINAPIRKGIVYNKYISYNENLLYVSNSKAVLNLLQDGAEGITLRDYEAIGLNKILITNSRFIKQYTFYTEEKIVFIDSIESDSWKIKQFNQNKEWKNKSFYSSNNYYKWLLLNLSL